MTWLRILGTLAALAALATATLHLAGERIWPMVAAEAPIVPFEHLTGRSAANEFLACPRGFCGREPDLASPSYAVPPEELRALLLARLAERGIVAGATSEDGTLRFTTHSPTLRFPDHTDLRVLPDGRGGSTLAIRAKALVGEADFGVNEKRVRDWLALLADQER